MRDRSQDVDDIVQEVYLRLLRVSEHEFIRCPEAYMLTIAFHVLHEYRLRLSGRPEALDIDAASDELESSFEHGPESQAETWQRLERLQRVVEDLPDRARVVLLMHRHEGMTLEEIAGALGLSRAMVAKYLCRALVHCRQAFAG